MPLSRRHFLMGTTGAVLSTARPGAAWPVQTLTRASLTEWQPNAALLRHLPRLLGLALAVVDGKQVLRRGFGQAIEEPSLPVSEETVFEAASLGKPVFAYAVLRMVDAGVIDLDRPLYDYLPIADANNPRMKRLTAR